MIEKVTTAPAKVVDTFRGAFRASSHRRQMRKQGELRPRAVPGAGSSTNGHHPVDTEKLVDVTRRRDALTARLAELQWDLGGLVYEMAVRDRIRLDVIVARAAALQDVDAELNEVERIVRIEQTGSVGSCGSCGAPHSSGAVYCWQCGQPLLEQVSSESIGSQPTQARPGA